MLSVRNILREYGSDLSESGIILNLKNEPTSMGVEVKRGKFRIVDTKTQRLYASGPTTSIVRDFVEKFWFWKKLEDSF